MFKRSNKSYKVSRKSLLRILSDSVNPLTRIVDLIPDNSSVLDVGAGNGVLGFLLSSRKKNIFIDGVEPNTYASKLAKNYYHKFYNDFFQNISNDLKRNKYDFVVTADVLEHVVDPLDFLYELKKVMASKTKIVFSVPNVAYGSTRIDLMNGHFNYTDSGIIEKTHLRFFTYDTLKELIEKSGLYVERVIYLRKNYLREVANNVSFLYGLTGMHKIVSDDKSFVYQYIFVLSKSKKNKIETMYGKKSINFLLEFVYLKLKNILNKNIR